MFIKNENNSMEHHFETLLWTVQYVCPVRMVLLWTVKSFGITVEILIWLAEVLWWFVEIFKMTYFYEDVYLCQLNFGVWGEHLTTQVWWKTARRHSHIFHFSDMFQWSISIGILIIYSQWYVGHEDCWCDFSAFLWK